MDEHGVATAVLSLSMPGVWFGDAEAARSTARSATNTLRDSRRAIRAASVNSPLSRCRILMEAFARIEYALDVLKADGIAC